jgi:NitT/TauT family transport system substrate-binding protein
VIAPLVKMQYLGNSVELTNAFIAGQLDVMSAIEPYATRGLMATKGNVLGDGVDMYGAGYPDCVLIARKELIDKEPKVVKDVIRVFFESEAEIEANFEEAAKATIGKYYKTDMTSLLAAAKAQPPGVDIRNKKDFMFGRAQSMKDLNMNLTFLGMAMIGLVGFLLDAAFGLVQRRVLWWRRATEL